MTCITPVLYPNRVGRPKTKEKSTTFRLAADVFALLEAIREKEGLDFTAIVEKCVRDYAKRNKITVAFRTTSGASMTAEQKAEYTTDTGQG